jgi:hypothetical protein
MSNWNEHPAIAAAQTLCIPPRATAFRAVCEACAATQLPSRGYLGATVEGKLPLGREYGWVVCSRGHEIRVLRAVPATLVH